MTDATVRLWGTGIGAVSWVDDRRIGVFQYMPDFAEGGVEVAPIMMPRSPDPYEFPSLPREAFKGLPGLLADALPDKFGNALIDTWLAGQGRTAESFNPVERLCYVGARGMGALEFHPTLLPPTDPARSVRVAALVDLANRVLNDRLALTGVLSGDDGDRAAIEDILRVGTSAGGARAKAILAWNPATGEFRSGQAPAADGFSDWLMKFDGISNNADKELADPQGFGRIEYAYHLMALASGIDMTECRLHQEGGRSHFMTRRFDRTATGQKLHMQSLAALRHFDFNAAGAYSYEQALQTIRMLDLPAHDLDQQVRRAVFNILGRNQDDHVKNIAFLMDRSGQWRLSPAFDLSYAHNPQGAWTQAHQMRLNGKQDGFERADLIAFAESAGLKRARANTLIDEVATAIAGWRDYAAKGEVPDPEAARIGAALRAI
ncbi:MAG: type II toxin-antitoxin system HipA family toxin [Phenylobacterium sp.]